MAEHQTKAENRKRSPGRECALWAFGRSLGALLLFTVAFLALLLMPTGCKDDAAETGSGEQSAGTDPSGEAESPEEESEQASTAADSEGPSAEDAFLAEIARITPILSREEPPAAVLEAVEQHLEENQARIDEVVATLSRKRAAMTPSEREAFEDGLSGREEVAAFFDAMESFRSRATAEQMDALDALFARILPEEQD